MKILFILIVLLGLCLFNYCCLILSSTYEKQIEKEEKIEELIKNIEETRETKRK